MKPKSTFERSFQLFNSFNIFFNLVLSKVFSISKVSPLGVSLRVQTTYFKTFPVLFQDHDVENKTFPFSFIHLILSVPLSGTWPYFRSRDSWGRSVAIHVIKITMLRQQTNQRVLSSIVAWGEGRQKERFELVGRTLCRLHRLGRDEQTLMSSNCILV